MTNINIAKYIEALGDKALFVGKADENHINFIEQELDVILPESYKSFLRDYGLAVLPGFEILGNGLFTVPACVESTEDWRKYGLPRSMVVIEDEGTDWIYCLETSKILLENVQSGLGAKSWHRQGALREFFWFF